MVLQAVVLLPEGGECLLHQLRGMVPGDVAAVQPPPEAGGGRERGKEGVGRFTGSTL